MVTNINAVLVGKHFQKQVLEKQIDGTIILLCILGVWEMD
jgi:hypothetical protein